RARDRGGAYRVHAIRRVLVCLSRIDGRIGRAVHHDVRANLGDRVCHRAKIGHVEIESAKGTYVLVREDPLQVATEQSVRASDEPARHRLLLYLTAESL